MKKSFIIIKKVILISIILPILLIVSNYTYNNIALSVFERNVDEVKFPENCKIVTKEKCVGNFYGNGDGIDYLVYYIIETDMTEQQLINYFNDTQLSDIKHTVPNCIVTINKQPDNMTIDVPNNCKLIIFADEGHPALLDIRGS